jgi:hypothetical protein
MAERVVSDNNYFSPILSQTEPETDFRQAPSCSPLQRRQSTAPNDDQIPNIIEYEGHEEPGIERDVDHIVNQLLQEHIDSEIDHMISNIIQRNV